MFENALETLVALAVVFAILCSISVVRRAFPPRRRF